MNREQMEEWRRQRVQILAAEMGGAAALGRAIGHSSGTQVHHMIAGKRSISGKTMDAIEKLPGREKWFTPPTFSGTGATIVDCLEAQRDFLHRLSPVARRLARISLIHFLDHPEELMEVARALMDLEQEGRDAP